MHERTALVLGATGLVGRHCLNVLLADDAYGRVVTLGRRALERSHPKLTHHIVDLNDLAAHGACFAVHDVFCCLGTTMKQAGSKAAFRRVDFDYAYEAAKLASEAGAEQYLLVSSIGADVRSPFFYTRVKGEIEEAVSVLPFYGVYLFRPSALTGARATPRPGEQVSERVLKGLSFVLKGPLRKYRPIPGATVARALVRVARDRPGGVRRYKSDAIAAIGQTWPGLS